MENGLFEKLSSSKGSTTSRPLPPMSNGGYFHEPPCLWPKGPTSCSLSHENCSSAFTIVELSFPFARWWTVSVVDLQMYFPFVYWGQDVKNISLRVELKGVQTPTIDLNRRALRFMAHGAGVQGPNDYIFQLDFFEPIQAKVTAESFLHECTVLITKRFLSLLFRKVFSKSTNAKSTFWSKRSLPKFGLVWPHPHFVGIGCEWTSTNFTPENLARKEMRTAARRTTTTTEKGEKRTRSWLSSAEMASEALDEICTWKVDENRPQPPIRKSNPGPFGVVKCICFCTIWFSFWAIRSFWGCLWSSIWIKDQVGAVNCCNRPIDWLIDFLSFRRILRHLQTVGRIVQVLESPQRAHRLSCSVRVSSRCLAHGVISLGLSHVFADRFDRFGHQTQRKTGRLLSGALVFTSGLHFFALLLSQGVLHPNQDHHLASLHSLGSLPPPGFSFRRDSFLAQHSLLRSDQSMVTTIAQSTQRFFFDGFLSQTLSLCRPHSG